MNTMKSKMVSAVYVSPEADCREMFVEGILCQSVSSASTTEEWDIVDLSKM
jgi:hypothetical protein